MLDSLVGNRYGKLTVMEYYGKVEKLRAWICLCDCGNTKTVKEIHLKRGKTKSCGCLKHESQNKRHGLSHTSFERKYQAARSRCSNPNLPSYKYYGGRGIKFLWGSLEEFSKDMLETYSEGMSLERIDVDGDYCKENCKWIEFKDQARNHRKQSNNTSGVVGVIWLYSKERDSTWAVASWQEFGKEQRLSFSVKKLGLLPAFAAAVEHRELQLDRLEKQGVTYGEHHRCRIVNNELQQRECETTYYWYRCYC